MYTHGGLQLTGLGDFNFDPSNPFGLSQNSLNEANAAYINDQVSSAYDPNILTSTVSAPTVVDSSTPAWQTQLTNLIPGLATTAEKILTTQFAVPQTGSGQFYTNKNGTITTYTLPSSSGASLAISNPFGASVTSSGNLLPLLAIGGLALFLFSKKG